MIAWHYTTGQKYELIKQTGILLPAEAGVEPPEQPILWFSTHPRYEPSALKPIEAPTTREGIRLLTLDEMYEMADGLYRFGYPIAELKCGENLRKAAKMPSIWWRRLAKRAANLKADPADWWGHVGSLPLSAVTVEKMDTNKRWVSVTSQG